MGEWIGVNRRARRCYGFDEVALVPGRRSINPEDVDTTVELCGFKLPVPILAAAMDGVVDTYKVCCGYVKDGWYSSVKPGRDIYPVRRSV